MWLLVMGTAKPSTTMEQILERRTAWLEERKENILRKRCKSAQRFSVVGWSPQQAFWLLETDDPGAADVIVDHFGQEWDLKTRVIMPEAVVETITVGKRGREKR